MMRRRKAALPMLGLAFMLGAMGVLRFAGHVRTVDIVGLFASGMMCGAALVAFIVRLRYRSMFS